MHSFDEERLFIISDTHIGNPSFENKERIIKFLDFVIAQGVNLAINGDGIDFLQPSLHNFVSVLPDAFRRVVRIAQEHVIYYIVGNHDIYFEQFLFDLETFKVVPFLNIRSGKKNIRIEHAHIYDDLYIRYPKAYHVIGKLWGYFLRRLPGLYPTYGLLEKITGTVRVVRKVSESSSEEKPVYRNAAALILERGFDAVIFGHTHRARTLEINTDKFYYNTGSWFEHPHYVEINNGVIKLNKLEGVPS
jgi:UDP-2,3-diacylglucosamine pyrophosphatase LpxH